MKILFVSLGCDKNLVDSEVMLGLLTEKGYTITNDEQEADIIVINTCCFIHDAKEESIMTILEMAALKEQNLKALIVTGCLAERYKEEILEEIPEIDAVLGTTSYTSILEAVDQALAGKKYTHYEPVDYLPDNRNVQRMVTTGNYMAYMKIGEGCDKRCTYCVIPKIRGSYRSVPMEELLAEARRLAQNGVKELVLVAQETTVYGVDLYGKKTLPKLLKELCKIDGIEWIRLLYCYPEEITEELIQTIKEEKKICHYIDMPIQHCDDKILQRMGRRTNQAQLREVIRKFREEIPDMVIRTSLITGFPGESSEQHENLLNFVDEMEFERLGVFTYSQEEDTIAAGFEDQIPEEIKEQRRDEIMALQQEISYEQDETLVGTEMKVLIEGYLYEDDIYVGRTYRDAPKVDGCIFVHAEEEIISGDFVNVRVTAAREYDLIGDVIYDKNIPNYLTILRVIMIPFFVFFMVTDYAGDASKWISVALFIIASLTDFLDGHLARKHNIVSNFGKFMDPLADKMLVSSAMICLTEQGRLAAWIVIIIISREFIISGFRLIAADNGVVIAASYWGKFKTNFQMFMIIMLIINLGTPVAVMIENVLIVIATALTIISLIDYLAKNKQVLAS